MQPIGNESDLFGESSSAREGESPLEIWKTHPDHPGYEFSNLGRVYSHFKRRLLKGSEERTKHIKVELVKRDPTDKRPQPTVHQLILEVFVGPCPPDKDIVCHINGNPRDNRVENLRWGTYQENSFDRHKHNGTSKGGRRSRVKSKPPLIKNRIGMLRNSLSEILIKDGDCETIQIPKRLAHEILAELDSISPP